MKLQDITVIVPTKNEKDNIVSFLTSLPKDLALIVVDASTDTTPELIAHQRPTNTQLVCHPSSISIARQIGAEMAQTNWLLFTDADVIFADDYFAWLPHDDSYGVYYGAKLTQNEFKAYYKWFTWGQRQLDRLGFPAASGSNMLIRRDAFFASGGFDTQLVCNEDSELAWRIQRHGYRVRFVPELIVYARDHRRLQRGVGRKFIHSVGRCALLYLNLMPNRWRTSDWGYWDNDKE